jgi:hypothetical protein
MPAVIAIASGPQNLTRTTAFATAVAVRLAFSRSAPPTILWQIILSPSNLRRTQLSSYPTLPHPFTYRPPLTARSIRKLLTSFSGNVTSIFSK